MIVSSETTAQDNIDAYAQTYGNRLFRISFSDIRDFIENYVQKLNVPTAYGSGSMYLRFYIGTDGSSGEHNVVIVPCYGNYESDWLSNHSNSFFALVGNASGSDVPLQLVTDINDCLGCIASRTTEKYVVEHTLDSFDAFVDGGTSFYDLTLELALSNGDLTLIMRCRDSIGDPVTRTVGLASGLSFDEGNMIPPPANFDSCF